MCCLLKKQIFVHICMCVQSLYSGQSVLLLACAVFHSVQCAATNKVLHHGLWSPHWKNEPWQKTEGVLTGQPQYWDIWLVATVWLWPNDYILCYTVLCQLGSHSSGWYLCQWCRVAFGEITVWVWLNDDVCNTIILALCGCKKWVLGTANSHTIPCHTQLVMHADTVHIWNRLHAQNWCSGSRVVSFCLILHCSLMKVKRGCVLQWP